MVYLFETKIDPKLKVRIALSQVFGIGANKASFFLNSLGIQPSTLFGELSKTHLLKLRKAVDKQILVASRLKQEQLSSVNTLIKLRTYRGSRHKNNLPVRGQRTSTNARTQKNRKNLLQA
jgi:small subunit ribosomal protein S13